MPLGDPDPKFKVTGCDRHKIGPDIPLVRIYNHVDADDRGYTALSFNPTVPDLHGVRGGRFDCTPADRFRYLYAATTEFGIKVALWETLLKTVRPDSTSGKYLVHPKVLEPLTAQYFHVKKTVTLIDLRTPGNLTHFGAEVDLLACDDEHYECTRKWGEFIRSTSVKWNPQGLLYPPRQTLGAWGSSLVLYRDRMGNPTLDDEELFERGVSYQLGSVAGRLIVKQALAGTKYHLAR